MAENSGQFQPGQSGCPGGRRKEKPFRDALLLAITEAAGDRKKLRVIAERLVTEGMDGNVVAIKEIADRLDGKVPQGVIGGDEDDPPVKVTEILIRAASAGGN